MDKKLRFSLVADNLIIQSLKEELNELDRDFRYKFKKQLHLVRLLCYYICISDSTVRINYPEPIPDSPELVKIYEWFNIFDIVSKR